MAKILVDVDRDLVAAAQDALGERSMAGTVREALRRVVAQRTPDPLLDYVTGLDDEQVDVLSAARETAW